MNSLPRRLAVAALVASLTASGILLVGPVASVSTCTGTSTSSASKIQECSSSQPSLLQDGDAVPAVLALTAVPVVITGLALWLTLWAPDRRVARWLSACAFLLLCLLTGFSIGLLYIPAAVLSLGAIAFDRPSPRRASAS